ncbi:unnamed protein product [Taenia asiatica]|uniref:Multidrug and toxin extrusion protein n=1 Tax=Taenia asiatica TaxID=60517 RepID=A0A0R3W795_TAEAS|nr:unnamed protein product [Taenia asiatica]
MVNGGRSNELGNTRVGSDADRTTERTCWSKYFPNGFWYEWKELSKLAVPIMFTSLVEYLTAPISLFFCGKLGKTELAAAGLAISLFHTAGVSFIMGFLTAGLHVEMWHDWGVWFRLGVPGVVMFGLEWWICEAGSLTAGLRGEEALAVQTILNNVESIIFCTFPMGYGIAVAIRVGQFVGSNNSVGPKSTAFVGILTLVFVAIMNTVVLLVGRYRIPRIFTVDVKLIEATAYGMPSVVAYQFFDCIVGVCSGVIRGVGMQKFGAIVCCVSMYLIGGPLALCLLLLTDLVVPGFWWGLTIGMAIEVILYIIKCCRIDWVKMCRQAEKLTEIKFVSSNLRRETFQMAEYAKGKSEDHSEAAADVGGCGEDEESVKSIDSMYDLNEELPPTRNGLWARYFPHGFWYEWRCLAMLALPISLSSSSLDSYTEAAALIYCIDYRHPCRGFYSTGSQIAMLTSMSNYAVVPISLFFLGRLGKTELAAGGLAISIFHVAGVSIIFGLLTASETLFPQFITIIEIFTKYIQAQNKVYPPLVASITGNIVNAGAHYLFNFHSNFGFVGSAISQSLGYVAQASVVVIYILVSRIYRTTWDAIHIELWHDWGAWFRLAIPGMMMCGLECVLYDREFCHRRPGEISYPSDIYRRSGVCSGIIRGVGMQRTGAIVCMVCMYLIGGPMGLGLLMMTDLSVSEQDGGEGTPHEDSSRGDGKVEACTPTILCTRAALIVFCVSTIVVALVCRFVLDWKAHFRSYCLLSNGTLLQVDPSEAVQANNQCLRILP